MPTLFQDRCGVSLYDAQYSTGKKGPIPDSVIKEVLSALLHFKTVCRDFSVPDTNTRIIATEATRTALNSTEYCQTIESHTGWKVELLPKEEEGRIGALGVASSFSSITGIVMDLGGGSIQLSWLSTQNSTVEIDPAHITSLPYGAAAMKRLVSEAEATGPSALASLSAQLSTDLRSAIAKLAIPPTTKDLHLYLSGGGFRGWGYLLMAAHPISPYPIPLINGFSVPKSLFLSSAPTQSPSSSSTFRISTRRATQVPAISFLISALASALPSLTSISFAQGGVREGLLFATLPPQIQSQHPLVAATLPYAPPSTPALLTLLQSAIPSPPAPIAIPAFLHSTPFLTALTHLLSHHATHPKDIRAPAALRSTTTGFLASSHGLLHADRALLALTLCARWGGEIPPVDSEFHRNLERLVGAEAAWWATYLGAVARGVGETYPAGVVRAGEERVRLMTRWEGEVGKVVVGVVVRVGGEEGTVPEWVGVLEKVGKKKNWVEGVGVKVHVEVEWEG
ncbi:hypothetical protein MMC30_005670 [Trapelia coarctata]|nr:hypothetical protein [Trapelia coarctata]